MDRIMERERGGGGGGGALFVQHNVTCLDLFLMLNRQLAV